MKKSFYFLLAGLILILIISGFLLKDYLVSRDYDDSSFDDSAYAYQVIEVIDGDTIVIETGNYVRLIGIDAPERNESYYNESREFLENLVLGRGVRLKRDINDRDNYGRLLRYVYLEDSNVSVNILLVESGYALPLHISPNLNFKEEINKAYEKCLVKSVGLCG